MQPKACANVTRFCNQVFIAVTVQIHITDYNRFPNSFQDADSSDALLSVKENPDGYRQRLSKPLSEISGKHD
jgi:hypothetical protein